MTLPDEFLLIERCFAPLAVDSAARHLADDAAVLPVAAGCNAILTVDTIIAGVHFLPDDPPGLVARKLLRVNLSDLAAMAARPRGYLLATSWGTGTTLDWVDAFAAGLAEDQVAFGISLLGGDTTASPDATVLTLTAIGEAEAGMDLSRGGARPGDDVYLSGALGDGALGLKVLKGDLAGIEGDDADWLVRRFRLPEPRLALGQALAGLATAAIDVSDGLAADLGHVCTASKAGARIAFADLPLSAPARRALAEDASLAGSIVSGGDDYELLFTAPPDRAGDVAAAAAACAIPVTRIGAMTAGQGVEIMDRSGEPMDVPVAGYRHF